jgi:putative SOS response-associated peptidase YedK
MVRQLGLFDTEDDAVIETRVLPFQQAPVIVRDGGKRVVRSMQFSLVPAWSKERRVKFATHNARLVSHDDRTGRDVPIYEKPTWRGPFSHRHCLVPISGFIEPIYRGDFAGNMVCFLPKDHQLMAAAGIWEEWTSHETGEIIDSFSILTDDPHPFVKSIGHDRTPVFLKPEAYEAWLSDDLSPQANLAMLRKSKAEPDLVVEKDRPLKPGWEKRTGKGE